MIALQRTARFKGMSMAEKWLWDELLRVRGRTEEDAWSFKGVWGFRIFDFWNKQLGIDLEVIEINEELDFKKIEFRDKELAGSLITVFRVKAFDEEGLKVTFGEMLRVGNWATRKYDSAVVGVEKKFKERNVWD